MADEPEFYIVTPHDELMAILWNAHYSGLAVIDVIHAFTHAEALKDADEAVSLLGMGGIDTDPLGSILDPSTDRCG